MKKQKNQKRKRNNIWRVIIPVILAGLAVWGLVILMGKLSENAKAPSKNEPDTSENQPTEPKEDSDKDNSLVDNDDDKTSSGGSDKPDTPATNPDTGLKEATVEITFADILDGRVEVGGVVTNIVETGGTCTYTFTNPATGKIITGETDPLSNSSSTPCASISHALSDFTPGKWTVTLAYQSNKSKGISQKHDLQVP
jgi:cytoskeletal protein RodZ